MSLKTFFLGNNTYGFIKDNNIKPIKSLINKQLSFVTTNDFKDCAKNHCAATSLTNICIYYASKGYKNIIKDNYLATFKDIHKLVGDGPVFKLSGKAKKYFKNNNLVLHTEKLNNLADIKKSIDKGHPVVLLLMDALFNYHWILVFGYSEDYLEIIDNWHKDHRFYKLNKGSKLLSAKAYILSK